MENEQTTGTPPQTGQPSANNLADGLGAVLSNPELMAKLPQVMAMLRPMMEQSTSASVAPTSPAPADSTSPASASAPVGNLKSAPTDNRTALLLALKPFLSEDRRNAVDAMLRLSKLGDVLRQL